MTLTCPRCYLDSDATDDPKARCTWCGALLRPRRALQRLVSEGEAGAPGGMRPARSEPRAGAKRVVPEVTDQTPVGEVAAAIPAAVTPVDSLLEHAAAVSRDRPRTAVRRRRAEAGLGRWVLRGVLAIVVLAGTAALAVGLWMTTKGKRITALEPATTAPAPVVAPPVTPPRVALPAPARVAPAPPVPVPATVPVATPVAPPAATATAPAGVPADDVFDQNAKIFGGRKGQ